VTFAGHPRGLSYGWGFWTIRGRVDSIDTLEPCFLPADRLFCGSTFELIFPSSDEITSVDGTSGVFPTLFTEGAVCGLFCTGVFSAGDVSSELDALTLTADGLD